VDYFLNESTALLHPSVACTAAYPDRERTILVSSAVFVLFYLSPAFWLICEALFHVPAEITKPVSQTAQSGVCVRIRTTYHGQYARISMLEFFPCMFRPPITDLFPHAWSKNEYNITAVGSCRGLWGVGKVGRADSSFDESDWSSALQVHPPGSSR
jgi:hypothetical protein